MLKKTRSHPFNTGAQVRERDDLITRWLDPESPDTKVIGGVAPTFRQLAAGLSAHFKIRPLSERAVWVRLRAGLGEGRFRQIAEVNPEVWLGERAAI